MKKRSWAYAAVVVVLFVLAGYCYFAISDFLQPDGVHILGQYAHINAREKCYIVSTSGTDKAANTDLESIITVSGLVLPLEDEDAVNLFTGLVNVAAYPMVFDDTSPAARGYVDTTCIRIHYHTFEGYFGECEREYIVCILKSDPTIIVVTVMHPTGSVCLVSGDTKEDAMQNYERYLDEAFKSAE